LARRFRVWQKKRGNRRTGSPKLGSFGEAVFFAAFFLLGCGGLAAVFATLVVPQWRANHEFVAGRCLVLDSRLGTKQADNITLYRPEIQIEYEVDGETYRNWTYDVRGEYSADEARAEKILAQFRPDPNRRCDCWYDPSDPNTVVLVRSSGWWAWLTLIVPFSFMVIGGGGLAYLVFSWGKSTERRAVLAGRAGSRGGNGHATSGFPCVPSAKNVTDSPGTTLAFRLPTEAATAWKLVVTILACLVWNGIVSVFAFGAIGGHLRGEPDWLLTLVLLPFAAVGAGLALFLVRQLLATTGVGPTLVEISDQPLRPGGSYRLFLSQTGRLRLDSLEVILACDEEATFRHGTNTRTETRRVYEQAVFSSQSSDVRPAAPFTAKCEVELPAGAMHSFKSDHNEVSWKLIVRGDAAGRPRFERAFPLIVHPPQNGNPDA